MIWPFAAGVFTGASAVISLGVFHPRVALFGPQLSRVRTGKPQVALTFDDGPHPDFTPAVAEKLKQAGFTGTFFCVGEEAEKHPSVVKALVADGHEIANHTWSHDTFRHLFSAAPLTEDLRRCQQTLSAIAPAPRWYRPAVGIRNPPVHQAARAVGLPVITWSLAARDGAHPFDEKKALAIANAAGPGDVITLHDGVRGKNGAFRAETVRHLDVLLSRLRERQLSSVTVSSLAAR
ncbi:MAG: polysaccharide deacetylase family protein [Myxococcaceae bacterium]